jgi:DNA-binding response OmpR family regulator
MNDYLNKPIEVGDKVAFIRRNYRSLETATVVKLGMVMVCLSNHTVRHPSDVIVVEKAPA